MTANQLVAYNLRRARKLRDLTQEQAAERLEPYLGRKWSKAVFSAAETSVESDRVREFSADELLAFTAAFNLPLAWFFIPPEEAELRAPVTMGGEASADVSNLLDAVAPLDTDEVQTRLVDLMEKLPKAELPKRERDLADIAATRVAAAIARPFGHIQREAQHLRLVADILEQAPRKALGGPTDPIRAAIQHRMRKEKK
jgi:transcriptional regulator with XRE-family HTH domain